VSAPALVLRQRARPTIRIGRVAPPLVGIAAVVGVWVVCAELIWRSGNVVPAPWTVLAQVGRDWSFFWPNIVQTAQEAAWGFVWGNAAAFAIGIVFVAVPWVERLGLRLVIALYCLPVIASAPILQIILTGDRAKIAVASQSVVFTTLVGVTAGLRSADVSHLAVVRASGGNIWQQLIRVRVRAAIPAVFAGLKIAAPAAVLGAVIGEFLGGKRGLGVAMVASQQGFNVPRTWAIGVVLTAFSILAYVVIGAIGTWLAPWQSTTTAATPESAPRGSGNPALRIAESAFFLVASVALVIALWSWTMRWFDLNSFFAKRPSDVWHWLTGTNGVAHRKVLIDDMKITLGNAGLGYLVGTAGALALAVAVAASRTVERAVMPVAIAVRSVPLVAMTPLVALVFGRGIACVLVLAGMVTFFPSLVQLVAGLRTAPPLASDLVHSFGGNGSQQLLRVRVPYALPALFASARVAAPLAIVGATLAEWLATGKGMGNHIVLALARSQYNDLWSSVVVLTAVSVAVYGVVAAAETFVIRRFHASR
jgi:sulfonate transport system permease protein